MRSLLVAATVMLAFAVPAAAYDVPLDPHSPWPKFRRDARQTGLGGVRPHRSGLRPWAFHTRRGVFSSPVISGDGTVYVGLGRPALLCHLPHRAAALVGADGPDHRLRRAARRPRPRLLRLRRRAPVRARRAHRGARVVVRRRAARHHRRVHQLVRGQRRHPGRRHADRAQRQLPHLRASTATAGRSARASARATRPGRCRRSTCPPGASSPATTTSSAARRTCSGSTRRPGPAVGRRGRRQRGRQPAADQARPGRRRRLRRLRARLRRRRRPRGVDLRHARPHLRQRGAAARRHRRACPAPTAPSTRSTRPRARCAGATTR